LVSVNLSNVSRPQKNYQSSHRQNHASTSTPFAALVKSVFVDVACDEFDLPGKKQSVSRISVLTGINRKEVKRLLELPEHNHEVDNNNRAARVVSGWMRDSKFTSANGSPARLPLVATDDQPGFETLVKTYSGDMPVRSILDELVRVGAATVDDGWVQLTSTGYVPSTSNDELLRLSAEGVSDLLKTVDYNLKGDQPVSRLQLSLAYDDVSADGVELFRQLSREKSLQLLTDLDQFLANQDRSVNSSIVGDGRYRTGLGIYYFEEELNPDDEPAAEEGRSAQNESVATREKSDSIKSKRNKK